MMKVIGEVVTVTKEVGEGHEEMSEGIQVGVTSQMLKGRGYEGCRGTENLHQQSPLRCQVEEE